jgi:RNA polymerase sigma-B factor
MYPYLHPSIPEIHHEFLANEHGLRYAWRVGDVVANAAPHGDERTRLIEQYLPLVRGAAQRFAGRGESVEELVQVGSLALVTAVDRARRVAPAMLTAYVARCVEGEIRRHLRDRVTVVRVPRRVQADGVAVHFGPLDDDEDLPRELVDEERPEDTALTRALVAAAAQCLDGREREVVALRYFLDFSQAEVGEAVGVSQVHVSRLLRGASDKMRARLEADAAGAW